jgi:adenylate cyclase
MTFGQRLLDRAQGALTREAQHGLLLASLVRSGLVAGLLIYLLVVNRPWTGAVAWVAGCTALFLLLGLLQLWTYARQDRRRTAADTWRRQAWRHGAKYAFVALDCALLALLFLIPNPFREAQYPPAQLVHGPLLLYFYVFMVQAAFSLTPALMLWTGAMISLAWLAMGLLPVALDQASFSAGLHSGPAMRAALQADPNLVLGSKLLFDVVMTLLLAGGLAVAVWRNRAVAVRQARAERARANLARYFSPNVVDLLSSRADPFGRPRRQPAAILFADLQNYTSYAETAAPEQVLAVLQEFHGLMEGVVFDHGGTLEKYVGDAMMVSFGTPDPDAEAAAKAVACARAMLAAFDAWRGARGPRSEAVGPSSMGIGVHQGPVVLGTFGSERSLSMAVVGDTVNVASRLQGLTRKLRCRLAASGDLVDAAGPAGAGLHYAGLHQLRGREKRVAVWTDVELSDSARLLALPERREPSVSA